MEWADHYRVPALSNENMRGDEDPSEMHAEDAAAGAALLCAGSCAHTQQGKWSLPFSATTNGAVSFLDATPFVQAWVRGAQSVPVEFQPGAYMRHEEDKPPNVLRVYERRLSDGRGHVVEIRA
jgi:hypothetical protein